MSSRRDAIYTRSRRRSRSPRARSITPELDSNCHHSQMSDSLLRDAEQQESVEALLMLSTPRELPPSQSSSIGSFDGHIQSTNSLADTQQELCSQPEQETASNPPSNITAIATKAATAQSTNEVEVAVMRHTEPPEAHLPSEDWLMYVFRANDNLGTVTMRNKSVFLFGRDRRIADQPTDHASCSKQHAVIQFRQMREETPVGQESAPPCLAIKPYIMDLGSVNGTFVNEDRLTSRQYHELRTRDIVRFGHSGREYVVVRADRQLTAQQVQASLLRTVYYRSAQKSREPRPTTAPSQPPPPSATSAVPSSAASAPPPPPPPTSIPVLPAQPTHVINASQSRLRRIAPAPALGPPPPPEQVPVTANTNNININSNSPGSSPSSLPPMHPEQPDGRLRRIAPAPIPPGTVMPVPPPARRRRAAAKVATRTAVTASRR